MKTKLESLPKSRVRLTITVPADIIAKHYEEATNRLIQHVEIKGFRKGKAPRLMAIEKVGNGAILNEMLELIIPDTYYKAVAEQQDLTPVSQPTVDVKEFKGLEDGGTIPTELTYTAEADVMPDVKLGNYKKIKIKAKKAEDIVDDAEVDKTIDELKKMYGEKYLEVGNFKDEAAFREAIAGQMKEQKVLQAESETYDLIIEELLKTCKLEVPESFTHNEIHRMERQIEMQAKMYGMTFDDWLKAEKKTHEDIHSDWHDQAEKAAKVGVILGKIAEAEGIDPSSNDASRLVLEMLRGYAVGDAK